MGSLDRFDRWDDWMGRMGMMVIRICTRYMATRIQGYKATMQQCYKATRLQDYNATMLQGYKSTRLQGYIYKAAWLSDSLLVTMSHWGAIIPPKGGMPPRKRGATRPFFLVKEILLVS